MKPGRLALPIERSTRRTNKCQSGAKVINTKGSFTRKSDFALCLQVY